MFGDSKTLIQLDMSEYMEKFNVSRLLGSPPGYVGYEEGGQLTEQVRRKPYSVVLFDEIEKAHPDVWNVLLQILEEGKLTDNVGRVVNFRQHHRAHDLERRSDSIRRQNTLGFSSVTEENSYEKMKEKILDEAKKTFRPEFLNRLDDVIVFRSLAKPDLIQILNLEINKVLQRLKNRHIDLQFDDKARTSWSREDLIRSMGARRCAGPWNAISKTASRGNPQGNLHENDPIQVTLEGDNWSSSRKPPRRKARCLVDASVALVECPSCGRRRKRWPLDGV